MPFLDGLAPPVVVALGLVSVLLVVVLTLSFRVASRRADPEPLRDLGASLGSALDRVERALRDEVARSARDTRQELGLALGTFQRTLIAQQGDVARTQNEQIDGFRVQLAETRQALADAALRLAEQQGQALGRFSEQQGVQLRAVSEASERRLADVRSAVEQRLASLQQGNEQKLEQMRATVDEKLHATLEQRLGASFRQVAERLDQVHRGLGEMQVLARDVGSLSRVLGNVKTRGIFGEVQLAGLLEQVFTPEQYGANVETVPGSGARVEFAIRLPGQRDGGAVLWLPIDAKFPRDDYERLLDAQEAADQPAAEAAARAIEQRLRLEARGIRSKYVAPPHTTEFAILFVPTEGLYAEALRRPGLMEALQRDHRVMLAGPTTLLATLNSLQMGFRTLALERRSAEVWEVLGAVKTEFAKFGDALAKTKRKLDEASSTIGAAQTRSNVLARTLKSVEALPERQASALVPGLDEERSHRAAGDAESAATTAPPGAVAARTASVTAIHVAVRAPEADAGA